MAAHPEMQLLSRIYRTGCLKEVVEWGITHDDFRTPIPKGMWRHTYGFFQDAASRGAVLGLNSIKELYPEFELCDDISMTTEALCHVVRETRIKIDAKLMLSTALDDISVDPGKALISLQHRASELIELGSTKNMDVSFSNMIEDIVIDYERAEEGIPMSGVTWPWGVLNEEMGGLLEDDYIVLYGRPKCLPLGTPVIQPDGSFVAVENATSILGLSHTTHRLQAQHVTGQSNVVVKDIVKVTTQSGHELIVGQDHPILRPDFSYMEAGSLAVGDYVGTVRQLEVGEEKGDPGTYELAGKTAKNAEAVPSNLFRQNKRCIAAFLGGLLSADESARAKNLQWNVSKPKMAGQVKHLLLRLGVVGVLSQVTSDDTCYRISVDTAEEQAKVLEHMAPYVTCKEKLMQHVQNVGPDALKWADSDVYWDKVVSVQHLGPAQCIDISTSGDHNFVVGDVITHNSMKSWVLSFLIAHFFYILGLRVLVYTKEMTPKNIFRRIAACMGNLPYQEMRFGKMTRYEKDCLLDIRDMAQELRHKDNLWCLSGKDTPGHGTGDTISWLMTKVERYRPHVVLIDGLYLMSTSKPSQKDNVRVQTISRECRQMVLDTGIPVIATAQANRQAAGHNSANLDEIAHSDAIGQDATAAFRVINEQQTPTIILATAGSREFKMDGFRINAIPASDFSYHSLVTTKELEKAKEKDGNEDDQEPEKKKKRSPVKRKEEEQQNEEKENRLVQEQIARMRQH